MFIYIYIYNFLHIYKVSRKQAYLGQWNCRFCLPSTARMCLQLPQEFFIILNYFHYLSLFLILRIETFKYTSNLRYKKPYMADVWWISRHLFGTLGNSLVWHVQIRKQWRDKEIFIKGKPKNESLSIGRVSSVEG